MSSVSRVAVQARYLVFYTAKKKQLKQSYVGMNKPPQLWPMYMVEQPVNPQQSWDKGYSWALMLVSV